MRTEFQSKSPTRDFSDKEGLVAEGEDPLAMAVVVMLLFVVWISAKRSNSYTENDRSQSRQNSPTLRDLAFSEEFHIYGAHAVAVAGLQNQGRIRIAGSPEVTAKESGVLIENVGSYRVLRTRPLAGCCDCAIADWALGSLPTTPRYTHFPMNSSSQV